MFGLIRGKNKIHKIRYPHVVQIPLSMERELLFRLPSLSYGKLNRATLVVVSWNPRQLTFGDMASQLKVTVGNGVDALAVIKPPT